MLKNNAVYETEITDYTADGMGIAHAEGCAVFIPNAIAGERVRISIVHAGKNKAIGKIFANNVPFGAMVGAGIGLLYAQTKWRFVGVSDTLREGVETMLKKA